MIASTLVANNAKVYIVDLDQARVDAISARYSNLASEAGSAGQMVGISADCGSKAEAARLARELENREDYVTVLFNNAGNLFFFPLARSRVCILSDRDDRGHDGSR